MGSMLSGPVSSKHLDRNAEGVIRVGAAEMQGYRPDQEDQHSIHLSLPNNTDYSFIGVYDGHSGKKVSAWLQKELYQRVAKLENPMDQAKLIECVEQADLDYIATEKDEQPNGAACIFAIFKEKTETKTTDGKKAYDVLVANVGDSRVILVKADGRFEALSEDHKPENEEEKKRIEMAGGTVSDNRVDGQLAMSRAMGDAGYKRNESLTPTEQKVIATAECMTGVAHTGDLLLVCCDGIVETLENDQVAAFLHSERKTEKDPALLCAALLEFSLKAGSKDNHTAVLVDFGTSTEEAATYSAKPEFLAGPFTPYKADKKFVSAYMNDAATFFGAVNQDELMKLAKETEDGKKMEVFAVQNSADPQEQIKKMFGEDVLTNPEKMKALQRQLSGEPELPQLSPEEQQAALLREKIAQMTAIVGAQTAQTAQTPKNTNACAACDKPAQSLKACGACKSVVYCTVQCQKQHWKAHKAACKKAKASK